MLIAQERNMTGVIKPFDQDSHDRTDQFGKNSFINYVNRFHRNGLRTIENPDRYGIDLLTLNTNNIVVRAWEIEVREDYWISDTSFPDKTVNCIERKEHLWRKDSSFYSHIPYEVDDACETVYVQMNRLGTRAVIIPGNLVLKYRKKLWPNKFSKKEFVRQVPLDKVIQIRLSTGQIER